VIKIFISHSSTDVSVAALLAQLFQAAFSLSPPDIRCTSVDGYRLSVGLDTDEQLRREVREAPVLVGLISRSSFESAYVLFELGARWGAGKYLAPLLVPGEEPSILRGPLSGLNALSSSSTAQLHQLVNDVGAELGIVVRPAHEFEHLVDTMSKWPGPRAEQERRAALLAHRGQVPARGADTPIDAPEMLHVFQSLHSATLTSLQKQQFVTRHQGTRVKWDVVVSNVSVHSNDIMVLCAGPQVRYEWIPELFFATFPKATEADLAALTRGDEATIAGELVFDSTGTVAEPSLRNCSLVAFRHSV
jgi:hypothetical protein